MEFSLQKRAWRCFIPLHINIENRVPSLHYWLFSAPTHYQTKVSTTTSKFHSNDWSFNAPIHYQNKDPNYDIPLALISFKVGKVIVKNRNSLCKQWQCAYLTRRTKNTLFVWSDTWSFYKDFSVEKPHYHMCTWYMLSRTLYLSLSLRN